MAEKTLPIDRVPKAPVKIGEPLLSQLNAAFYRAHAAQADAALAQRAAQDAAAAFLRLRERISSELGTELGATHGWDETTGEVGLIRG